MYVISANWNICVPFDNGSTLKNVPPPSCQIFLLCSLLSIILIGNAYNHMTWFCF